MSGELSGVHCSHVCFTAEVLEHFRGKTVIKGAVFVATDNHDASSEEKLGRSRVQIMKWCMKAVQVPNRAQWNTFWLLKGYVIWLLNAADSVKLMMYRFIMTIISLNLMLYNDAVSTETFSIEWNFKIMLMNNGG